MNQKYESKMALFLLQQGIRDFFRGDEFLEVQTPPMVSNPGMEPHIHPFRVSRCINDKRLNQYLHTSPEFCMKELLSLGLKKIFTQTFCFRDEPKSDLHRPQFLMLEWYRKDSDYNAIIEDISSLFTFLAHELQGHNIKVDPYFLNFSPEVKSVNQIFIEILGFEILDYLETVDLLNYIQTHLPEIPLPPEEAAYLSWDDLYFLIFLNLIEPKLEKKPFLIIDQFPYHLSSLASINQKDKRTCNRFELYCYGVEIANCFGELDNLEEQKFRFQKDAQIKQKLYGYSLPEPTVLYDALALGIGESAGIALGIERLLKILTQNNHFFYD